MAPPFLIIGAGGVGSSAALIAARRDFFEHIVIADYDGERARDLVGRIADQLPSVDRRAGATARERPLRRCRRAATGPGRQGPHAKMDGFELL